MKKFSDQTVFKMEDLTEKHHIHTGLRMAGTERLLESEFYRTGETAKVKAMNREGWVFVNWTEEDRVVSEDCEYEFKVKSDCYLVANFIRAMPGGFKTNLPSKEQDFNQAI